jgi:ATP-dependent RNA helicase RhlE
LNLLEPILRGVLREGYADVTPIQAQAIPPLLDGRDVLGCAQTGTGKTAAFLLPILDSLARNPMRGKPCTRALILTPTRELAAQIGDSFSRYAQFLNLRHVVIFGGVNQRPQVASLRRGIDVLIATPGRLIDLQDQGYIETDAIEFFVLDEADRMLDMGFIRDIRRILKWLPRQRQNLLFSATMPDSIVKLASAFLHDPVRVEVDRQSTTVERITQQVMFVARPDKRRLLKDLLQDPVVESAIVFTRTKHGANRVTGDLSKAGIESAAIHGNKSQGARQRALEGFKRGQIRVLVATDIASRGIDVDGVSHVFNYELPNIAESYVHRIGRTGRAGRQGIAIALCDESETEYLIEIEKLIKKPLDVVLEHKWHFPNAMPNEAFGQSMKRGASRRPQRSQQHQDRSSTKTDVAPSNDSPSKHRQRRPRRKTYRPSS